MTSVSLFRSLVQLLVALLACFFPLSALATATPTPAVLVYENSRYQELFQARLNAAAQSMVLTSGGSSNSTTVNTNTSTANSVTTTTADTSLNIDVIDCAPIGSCNPPPPSVAQRTVAVVAGLMKNITVLQGLPKLGLFQSAWCVCEAFVIPVPDYAMHLLNFCSVTLSRVELCCQQYHCCDSMMA